MMDLTPEQMEAIAEESELAAVMEMESEMQERDKPFVPPMIEGGEMEGGDEPEDILR